MRRGITLIALALLTLGFTAFEVSAQSQREVDLVRNWYLRFLGREPDASGLQSWSTQLVQRPANEVLADLLSSPEYFQRHGNSPQGFVTGLYFELLGRQPSADEVNIWLYRLATVQGDRAQTARDFLAAAGTELANRPGVFTPIPTQPAPLPSLPGWSQYTPYFPR